MYLMICAHVSVLNRHSLEFIINTLGENAVVSMAGASRSNFSLFDHCYLGCSIEHEKAHLKLDLLLQLQCAIHILVDIGA